MRWWPRGWSSPGSGRCTRTRPPFVISSAMAGTSWSRPGPRPARASHTSCPCSRRSSRSRRPRPCTSPRPRRCARPAAGGAGPQAAAGPGGGVDGDTPRPERDAIRRTANWILTNPDLLHHSLLPGHQTWGDFLHRLRFVIVDEAHVARGVFGSHVALVLRRLRRLAERYGADPTFVLASATIGNPAEHASELVGRDVVAVVEDGAPRAAGPRAVAAAADRPRPGGATVAAARVGRPARVVRRRRGADARVHAVPQGRRTGRHVRPGAARRRRPAGGHGAAYRAGYLPEERRALEEDLRAGRLVGLAATEALELGIDVSGLDAVLLAGYPGTFARFWQRLGRAGRAGGAATGVLVAADDPLDQYLVHHPDQLLGRPPEDAIVDPANPYLLAPHLRCACHEAPLDDEEAGRWFGPSAPGCSRRTSRRGGCASGAGGTTGPRGDGLRRRSTSARPGADVRIVDAETGALIGTVDEARAPRRSTTGRSTSTRASSTRSPRSTSTAPRRGHAGRGHPPHDPGAVRHRRRDPRRARGDRVGADRHPPGARRGDHPGHRLRRAATRVDEVLAHVELDLPPQHLQTVAVWYVLRTTCWRRPAFRPPGCRGRCTPPSTPRSACCR
jgi:DEAD/DEAH box helicase domain-containing protein